MAKGNPPFALKQSNKLDATNKAHQHFGSGSPPPPPHFSCFCSFFLGGGGKTPPGLDTKGNNRKSKKTKTTRTYTHNKKGTIFGRQQNNTGENMKQATCFGHPIPHEAHMFRTPSPTGGWGPAGTSTRFDLGQKYCGVNNGRGCGSAAGLLAASFSGQGEVPRTQAGEKRLGLVDSCHGEMWV